MSEKETACLRDITETDIMEYMQVEHPHNEKELWKMKHATPARIGIGRCGARYTTEAQLRFLAAHAAANDAVFNDCLLYTSDSRVLPAFIRRLRRPAFRR